MSLSTATGHEGQRRLIQLILILATAALWILPISVESYSSTILSPTEQRFHSTKLSVGKDPDDISSELQIQDKARSHKYLLPDEDGFYCSRRRLLQAMAVASVTLPVTPAFAGKPQYDKSTGALYSPKAEMLSGGSNAARGTALSASSSTTKLQPGQSLQNVYGARFITYLTRFLLTFDPSANAWWVQNVGLADTWDLGSGGSNTVREGLTRDEVDAKFAEFAESVEIGLADYFVGPYGSYGSVKAAAAGLGASRQVKSQRPTNNAPPTFLGLFSEIKDSFVGKSSKRKDRKSEDFDRIAKQGILNLYTLLKARYTSVSEKRQLAILFSFFENSALQPTAEIQSIMGEADNATISQIDWIRPSLDKKAASFRVSSQLGGGYSINRPPKVTIEAPPALGADYLPAKAKAILQSTTRVLLINVTDHGEGYMSAPEVTLSSNGLNRPCIATAILDRDGGVDSIVVLDPGSGYGKLSSRRNTPEPPKVSIAPPSGSGRRARALAELEYEIVGIEITRAGNGYVSTEPPVVRVEPPRADPDWFFEVPELKALLYEFGTARAEVSQMKGPSGNIVYTSNTKEDPTPTLDTSTGLASLPFSIDQIRRDPIELLPSSLRPVRNNKGMYTIPSVALIPYYGNSPNPRYRAVDTLFGSIGSVPVTKSALQLKTGEYVRLALSGAVCTVLVRTALNPLELIKTKLQLQNDEELIDFAKAKLSDKRPTHPADGGHDQDVLEAEIEKQSETSLGSGDLISSLVELRGPWALFQSADITFLASLMFGSFGFGATELFRRSFTSVFFNEGGDSSSELVLLLAATVATVITSFFAAPFELLRVRSMGLVEEKTWTEVLEDFISENSGKKNGAVKESSTGFDLKDLEWKDLLPLWAGFPPTASRELAFAIPKFLAFDVLANALTSFFNAQSGPGSLPIQVGVGTAGLAISALSGAVAGVAGAIVSHPADLILTYTSASSSKKSNDADGEGQGADWREVVRDLLAREGGIANLFVGLQPRLVFFFLVIGLQFFLYDYVKNLLNVGSDDLSLVLDVFYAVRQGLIDNS